MDYSGENLREIPLNRPPSCTIFPNEIVQCIFDFLVYGAGLLLSFYNSYCIAQIKKKQRDQSVKEEEVEKPLETIAEVILDSIADTLPKKVLSKP